MKTIFRTSDEKEFENKRDAEYHEMNLTKKEGINHTQFLMFELIKRGNWNGFNGEEIVAYLLKNKDLWDGVILNTDYYCLRDIEDDNYFCDTLWIKTSEDKVKDLKTKIKRNLNPDEISVQRELGCVYLSCWWD